MFLSPLWVCLVTLVLTSLGDSEGKNIQAVRIKENSTVVEITKTKRDSLYDGDCRGYVDITLFNRLTRVCDDCFNLYRHYHVSVECRRNCFTDSRFSRCVTRLGLNLADYTTMARRLASFD